MNKTIEEILTGLRSKNLNLGTEDIISRICKSEQKPNRHEIWHLCLELEKIRQRNESSNSSLFAAIGGEDVLIHFLDKTSHTFPDELLDFFKDYLSALKPGNILNPWTDQPTDLSFILNALPATHTAQGICGDLTSSRSVQLFDKIAATVFDWKKTPIWISGTNNSEIRNRIVHGGCSSWISNPTEKLKNIRPEWDVVICFPPLDYHHYGLIMMAESALKLSPEGVGLFIIPSFELHSSHEKARKTWKTLKENGLAIEAIISCNMSFTRLEPSLIIIKRATQSQVFVGELQNDPKRKSILIKNLQSKREAKECGLGMLVDRENLKSFSSLKFNREYLEKVSRQGLPKVNLNEIISEIFIINKNKNRGFSEKSNVVYIPNTGFSEVVTSTNKFKIKPEGYIQLSLKPEIINADFLAKYFNSELGLLARRSLMQYGTKFISARSIRVGVQIPLPALSVQTSVIEADTRLRDISIDVSNISKQLWGRPAQIGKIKKFIDRVNNEETFEDWLKTLPFPLASILWNYHAAEHEPKDQFKLLLKFFEGLAEFNAIILLSVARRDLILWDEVRVYLTKEKERFEKSGFGTWVELSAFISKRLRELWSQVQTSGLDLGQSGRARCEAAFGSCSSEVIESLLSKNLHNVLHDVNIFRNDFDGHYGALGEATATNFLAQLRSYLSDVKSSFGQAWECYQLLLPTNRSEWTGQYHEVRVNLLQGPNTPFKKEIRKLTKPLKRETLYFLNKDSAEAVELLPLLKISSAPKDADNACYFYNRRQSDGARYVSYHFEKQADITFPASEMDQLFTDLFGSKGLS